MNSRNAYIHTCRRRLRHERLNLSNFAFNARQIDFRITLETASSIDFSDLNSRRTSIYDLRLMNSLCKK